MSESKTALARNILLMQAAEKVSAAARKAGIPVILLKGAALLHRGVYAPHERQMTDIDLLVRAGDIGAFEKILAELGYKPMENSSQAWYLMPSPSAPPLAIDVHTGLRHVRDGAALWETAAGKAEEDGVLVLGLPDQFLHTASHTLLYHGRLEERTITDLARLLEYAYNLNSAGITRAAGGGPSAMRARPDEVRPGFRARHNYASRPGRKAAGFFPRSENAEAGSRKTAMRFMRDYASRRAPAMRAENCSSNFQAMASVRGRFWLETAALSDSYGLAPVVYPVLKRLAAARPELAGAGELVLFEPRGSDGLKTMFFEMAARKHFRPLEYLLPVLHRPRLLPDGLFPGKKFLARRYGKDSRLNRLKRPFQLLFSAFKTEN